MVYGFPRCCGVMVPKRKSKRKCDHGDKNRVEEAICSKTRSQIKDDFKMHDERSEAASLSLSLSLCLSLSVSNGKHVSAINGVEVQMRATSS